MGGARPGARGAVGREVGGGLWRTRWFWWRTYVFDGCTGWFLAVDARLGGWALFVSSRVEAASEKWGRHGR